MKYLNVLFLNVVFIKTFIALIKFGNHSNVSDLIPRALLVENNSVPLFRISKSKLTDSHFLHAPRIFVQLISGM